MASKRSPGLELVYILSFVLWVAIGVLGGFVFLWWYTLFIDYHTGFIGQYGGKQEKHASIVIQLILSVVFVVLFVVCAIISSYLLANIPIV